MQEFTTGGKRKIGKDDRIAFKIDGEQFTILRPKTAVIARVASVLEQGADMDDARNVRRMLGFVNEIVDCLEDAPSDPDGALRGRARIMERLNDPADSLDLEQLMPMFTSLMNGWFGRPTGSPPASSARRRTAPVKRVSRARTR